MFCRLAQNRMYEEGKLMVAPTQDAARPVIAVTWLWWVASAQIVLNEN